MARRSGGDCDAGCVFSRQVIYIFTVSRGRARPMGSGDLSEPNHFSGGFLHRPGGAGGGDTEQLSQCSGCRRRRRYFSIWWSSCFRSASCTGRYAMGASSLPNVRRSRWPSEFWSGAAFQLAMQIPALVRLGMRFRPEVSFRRSRACKRWASLMGPSFFGMGVYQINMLVDTIFATSSTDAGGQHHVALHGGPGDAAGAGKIRHRDVHGAAADDVAQAAAGKFDEMKQTFGFSLRIVSFIAIPAAVGLILLRQPIMQVLFQHGRFVAESTALTARALFFYSLGLPAFAAIKLITPMYYSTQDTMTPARVGAYALGMNIGAEFDLPAVLFSALLSNGSPALASSLAAYFNFGAAVLDFSQAATGGSGRAGLSARSAKMAVCAVAMAAVCVAALRYSNFAGGGAFPAAGGAPRGNDFRFDSSLFRRGMAAALRGIAGIISTAAAGRTGSGGNRA